MRVMQMTEAERATYASIREAAERDAAYREFADALGAPRDIYPDHRIGGRIPGSGIESDEYGGWSRA